MPRSLSRSLTFQERVQAAGQELERRLEPIMDRASTALDELGVLFDPEAVDEMLREQRPQVGPASVRTVCPRGACRSARPSPAPLPAAAAAAGMCGWAGCPFQLSMPCAPRLRAQMPHTASQVAVAEAVEETAQKAQEAKLERMGGSLINPHK